MADTSTGFIRLFRSIREWDWYDDPITKVVFIHCLVNANYKTKEWHGIQIPPGSFVSSGREIAAINKLSEKSVRRALSNLKSTGELTMKRVGNGRNAGTLYMLTNWDFFNGKGQEEDATKTQRRRSKDAQGSTYEEKKEGKKGRRTPKSPKGDQPLSVPYPVWNPATPEDHSSDTFFGFIPNEEEDHEVENNQ